MIRFTDSGGSTYAGTTYQNGNGAFIVYTGGDTSGAGSHKSVTIDGGGDVSLYDSTGVTQGFYWDASTQRLGLGETSPDTALHAKGSITVATIESTAANSDIQMKGSGTTGYTAVRANAETLALLTAGTNAITIDGSQNVGIGTSSPDTPLEVKHSSTADAIKISGNANGIAPYLSFENQESGTAYVRGRIRGASNGVDGGLIFETGSSGSMSEAMRITSAGSVRIGVSTPSGKLHLSESGATNAAATIFSLDGYHSTFGANLAKSSGTYTTPASSLSGGAWEYQPVNSLNGHGQMIYLSAPDTNSTASTPLERLRIDNSGNLLINHTLTGDWTNTSGAQIRASGLGTFTRSASYAIIANRLSTDGTLLDLRKDGTAVGSVSVTASGTTYNTTSDIRLKQDIEPLVATDKLMAMNPVSYNWKADPDGPRSMGFIAQEMQEVMPEAVAVGDDDDAMMSMDYGRITPILVSALQDAHKKIEQLEQRIADMEAK